MGAVPVSLGLILPGRPTGQMSRSPSTNALPGIMSNGARDTSPRSGRGSRRDCAPSKRVSESRSISCSKLFGRWCHMTFRPSSKSSLNSDSAPGPEDTQHFGNKQATVDVDGSPI
ncbi:uncharacterized protein VP01_2276g2, partial [Puccinia sorghi]